MEIILFSLDGLDFTKQKFYGYIRSTNETFHSYGAMDYENVLLMPDGSNEFHDNEFHETGRKWPQARTIEEVDRALQVN